MDPKVAKKLNEDDSYRAKVKKFADDYITVGTQAVEYYSAEFDTAHDAFMCYAQLTADEFQNLSKGQPSKFVLPMTATQVTTLTCFLSQILFGTNANRRVEPREDTDEDAAELMNQLLRWNDDQQPTYLTGYLFIQDALTFNRGIMYEYWKNIEEVELVKEDVIDDTAEVSAYKKNEDGTDQVDGEGKPVPDYPTFERWRKKRNIVGGYTKADLVSPYDFITDPSLPLARMQEGRFAGHRVLIPWHELDRRSRLKPTDPMYVCKKTVEQIKSAGPGKTPSVPSNVGSTDSLRSRSYYERQRRNGLSSQNGSVNNKSDGGVVECWSLQVRVPPKELDLYEGEEHEIVEILSTGSGVLSVNVISHKHDEFSYAVAEARPYAHYQFSPSWALMIQPLQRYCDYLKDRHQDALARTVGNIFVGHPQFVDFDAFTDPKKDGLIIPLKPDAPVGTKLNELVMQIPINDLTKDFYNEMQGMISMAENTSGAHSFMQGEREEDNDTATEFAAIQQMSSGRVSSVARLIWVQGIGPQTRRVVSNFQQYLPAEVVVRVSGDNWQPDDEKLGKYVKVSREGIQGHFDLVAHDGALPTTDARKVAAASRLIETISGNEILMNYFDPSVAGNIDLRKLFMHTVKATGIPVGNFLIDEEEAAKNAQQQAQKMLPPGVRPAGAPAPTPQGPPAPPGPGGLPSASALPPTPSAAPPPPRPA